MRPFYVPRSFLSLVAVLVCCWPSHAQTEQILDFHSDITLQEDSTLEVTETITVFAAGNQIRHGIYRDFPTTYATASTIATSSASRCLPPRAIPATNPFRVQNLVERQARLPRRSQRHGFSRPACLHNFLHHEPPTRLLQRSRRAILECHRSRLGLSHPARLRHGASASLYSHGASATVRLHGPARFTRIAAHHFNRKLRVPVRHNSVSRGLTRG